MKPFQDQVFDVKVLQSLLNPFSWVEIWLNCYVLEAFIHQLKGKMKKQYNGFILLLKIVEFIISKGNRSNIIQIQRQHQMERKSEVKIETKIEEENKQFGGYSSSISSENVNTSDTREGKWDDEENLKFTIFIIETSDIFKSKEKRKAERIFTNLSTFIETRNSRQCRSHFQKVMKKFSTIIRLKNYYKGLLGSEKFHQKVEQLKPKIQMINQDLKTKQKSVLKVQVEVQTQPIIISFCERDFNWLAVNPQNMYWYFPSFP